MICQKVYAGHYKSKQVFPVLLGNKMLESLVILYTSSERS